MLIAMMTPEEFRRELEYHRTKADPPPASMFMACDQLLRLLETMPVQTSERYSELLMAVGHKFPGESRHETALRYIREAEASVEVGSGCTAAMGSNVV